jgi:uncharacterized membrane protein
MSLALEQAAAIARPQVVAGERARLQSIDLLRGMVMVLMALDHFRDYYSAVTFNPLDLSQTTFALFATRWITHYCAPVFILLAGVSAWFVAQRRSPPELTRFLLSRGLWLVLLELTVIKCAWSFDPGFSQGQVLRVVWAIGWAMVALAFLVRLPLKWVATIGLVMIFGHNLLDGIKPEVFGAWAPLWSVLHVKGETSIGFVSYPLIPWIGVLAAGYALGAAYAWPLQRRRRLLVVLGICAIVLFVTLRGFNLYGEAQPWTTQSSTLMTALSFVNVTKYPPSLLYLLMTLGPALLALAALESVRGAWTKFFVVFGRVPLFFYIAHIALAQASAEVVWRALGQPESFGWGLPIVYLVWASAVLLLYPACRWFAEVKRRRDDWWLSYL